jgi:hypothetical protein
LKCSTIAVFPLSHEQAFLAPRRCPILHAFWPFGGILHDFQPVLHPIRAELTNGTVIAMEQPGWVKKSGL